MEKDFIIKEILEDIYKIDPNFKNEEAKIMKIVEEMLKNKPDLEPDENFVKELKFLIDTELEKKKNISNENIISKNKSFYKKAIFPAFATVFVLLIVFISVSDRRNGFLEVNKTENDIVKLSSVDITKLEQNNAFDILGGASDFDLDSYSEKSAEDNLDYNGTEALTATGGGGLYAESSDSMVPSFASEYEYIYSGEGFVQDKQKMEVLKRIFNEDGGDEVMRFLNETGLNFVDFSNFDNLKIKTFNIYQDETFGYHINVDLSRGSVYVYKNWEKWPNSNQGLKTSRLDDSYMPEEKLLFSKTEEFLKNMGVNLSDYGEPIVNYGLAVFEENGFSYLADDIIVLYPLLINDMNVYESYGELYGIRVGYDVANSRVSSVSNVSLQKYESSLYDLETDFDSILDNMKQNSNYYPSRQNLEEGNKIVLNTPKIGYVRYQRYYNYQEEEYLVPAIIFPIDGSSSYYRENIVVSLVKGFSLGYNNEFLEEPMKIEE